MQSEFRMTNDLYMRRLERIQLLGPRQSIMGSSPVAVLRAITSACSIGFIPVAVHFKLFIALIELETQASSQDVANWVNKERGGRADLSMAYLI